MNKQKIYIILEKIWDGTGAGTKLTYINLLRAFSTKRKAEEYLDKCDNNIYYEYSIEEVELE